MGIRPISRPTQPSPGRHAIGPLPFIVDLFRALPPTPRPSQASQPMLALSLRIRPPTHSRLIRMRIYSTSVGSTSHTINQSDRNDCSLVAPVAGQNNSNSPSGGSDGYVPGSQHIEAQFNVIAQAWQVADRTFLADPTLSALRVPAMGQYSPPLMRRSESLPSLSDLSSSISTPAALTPRPGWLQPSGSGNIPGLLGSRPSRPQTRSIP
jgi:hypothetical protein